MHNKNYYLTAINGGITDIGKILIWKITSQEE